MDAVKSPAARKTVKSPAKPASTAPASTRATAAEKSGNTGALKRSAAGKAALLGKPSGQTNASPLYAGLYKASRQARIEKIREGIPARAVGDLSSLMDVPKDRLSEFLGIPRATLNRKAREGKVLATDESERVLGMQALIGQVQTMVEQSGDPGAMQDFNAARWLSAWLNKPQRVLGGATPASYMDTVEGQKLVSNILEMVQSGAYA